MSRWREAFPGLGTMLCGLATFLLHALESISSFLCIGQYLLSIVCACQCECLCVQVYVCVHMSMHMLMCMGAHSCVYICGYVVYLCLHMCMHVGAHVLGARWRCEKKTQGGLCF